MDTFARVRGGQRGVWFCGLCGSGDCGLLHLLAVCPAVAPARHRCIHAAAVTATGAEWCTCVLSPRQPLARLRRSVELASDIEKLFKHHEVVPFGWQRPPHPWYVCDAMRGDGRAGSPFPKCCSNRRVPWGTHTTPPSSTLVGGGTCFAGTLRVVMAGYGPTAQGGKGTASRRSGQAPRPGDKNPTLTRYCIILYYYILFYIILYYIKLYYIILYQPDETNPGLLGSCPSGFRSVCVPQASGSCPSGFGFVSLRPRMPAPPHGVPLGRSMLGKKLKI